MIVFGVRLHKKYQESTSLTTKQTEAAKMLPPLASAALSRTNELAADAFSIELGVTKFSNSCGMVDAIRTRPRITFIC